MDTLDHRWSKNCPVTDKPIPGYVTVSGLKVHRYIWTDHNLPGVFNVCQSCHPEQFETVSVKLHQLNA